MKQIIPVLLSVALLSACSNEAAQGPGDTHTPDTAQLPVIVPDTSAVTMPVVPTDTTGSNMPVVTPPDSVQLK